MKLPPEYSPRAESSMLPGKRREDVRPKSFVGADGPKLSRLTPAGEFGSAATIGAAIASGLVSLRPRTSTTGSPSTTHPLFPMLNAGAPPRLTTLLAFNAALTPRVQ